MALLHRVRSMITTASRNDRAFLQPARFLMLSAPVAACLGLFSPLWLDAERAQGAEAKGGAAAAPCATKGIQPLDLLTIRAVGTLVDQPIDGVFLVEPSGKVALGPAYGRVDVIGLTREQAEVTIQKHLKQTLQDPMVQVTAAGQVAKWRSGAPPKAPYRISPDDLLRIRVLGTLLDQPIDGDFLVEPSGKVALGPMYGRVEVKGLTVEQAEEAIQERLRAVLREPIVSVTLAGWTSNLHLGTSLETKMAELDLQIRIAKGEVLVMIRMRKELEAAIKELRVELESLRKNAQAPPRGGSAEGKK